jgi:VCBS repeat-containing protein
VIVNRLPFALALIVPLTFVACGGEGLTLPAEGEPAHIAVRSGSGQTARVNETLDLPLVVVVTDTRDRPVAEAEVVITFNDGAEGGVADPATVRTNSAGEATSVLKLGTRQGEVFGKVAVPVPDGVTPVEASFTATSLPADAAEIRMVSGNEQNGTVGSPLQFPLVVEVIDQFGNPIAGREIQWVAEGGGSVSAASTITEANGHASVIRILGPTAGPQTTLASTAGQLIGSPVTFTHTATAGGADQIVKLQGDGQNASPGTTLPIALVVQVLDAARNPIADRPVTWVIGAGGGSVSSGEARTDAEGKVSTQWTLGPGLGENTVNAVVSGVGTATFIATAGAGAPSAANSDVSASPGTITAGTGSSTITVTVRDGSNNPVSGTTVTVASSGTGNTITPGSAVTGASGVVTFTFSSTVAEAKTITATASGVTISDQATITVQRVASITQIENDDPDPSVVGEAVRVDFTVTGSGGTPTGQVTVTADGGPETCSASVAEGFCTINFASPGTNRRLTASYEGDARFAPSMDRENHRVNTVPTPNSAPAAAFEFSCSDLTCDFTDNSTDTDGDVVAWSWNFGDPASGPANTSAAQFPTHTFSAAGTYTVTLRVVDNDGATGDASRQVTVTAAPPPNQPPSAQPDGYATPGAGQALTVVAPGVLVNDTDPDGNSLTAQNASDPQFGSVSLSSDGGFTYTPDPGTTSTSDTFTYEAFDGTVGSQATVTITITP